MKSPGSRSEVTTVQSDATVIGLTPRWSPALPAGENGHEASAVLNQVMERSLAFTNELRDIANCHFNDAPGGCVHVGELTGTLSRTILDWIEQWPS